MAQVKLISYSQPCKELADNGVINMQELTAYCARVSNPNNQLNTETSSKLISYLIKNKHWSPLEMVNACLEITTTRDIARQILRHRSFSFQEFCITGDSKITCGWYNKKGKFVPYYIPIEKLYERQNWDNYKNILVRIYDETEKRFTTTSIKEVFKNGIKPVFRVTLSDGKQIECTKEHKFLSRNGWDTLENISGLSITKTNLVTLTNPMEIAVNGDICFHNRDWLLEKKLEAIENKLGIKYIAQSAGVSVHTIKKWLKRYNLQFTKKEVALYTLAWNKNKIGYKLKPRTQEQRDRMKEITPKGEKHHAYKGGSATHRKSICNYFNSYRKSIFEKFNYECQFCKQPFGSNRIELHHIKDVASYPELAYNLNNVVPVHRKCHMEYHGKQTDTVYKNRTKHNGNTLIPRFVKIKHIEYIGERETYDMEVDHTSHNYVANKICVHNSQRYANVTDALSFETRETRLQDSKNRQNSIEIEDPNLSQEWEQKQRDLINHSIDIYNWAIANNIAKEQARVVLPEGNTQSRMYMNGTLRSWVHYIELRSGNGTQKEHREVALLCAEALGEVFPLIKELTIN